MIKLVDKLLYIKNEQYAGIIKAKFRRDSSEEANKKGSIVYNWKNIFKLITAIKLRSNQSNSDCWCEWSVDMYATRGRVAKTWRQIQRLEIPKLLKIHYLSSDEL